MKKTIVFLLTIALIFALALALSGCDNDTGGDGAGNPGYNPGNPGYNPGDPGYNPGDPGYNPGNPGSSHTHTYAAEWTFTTAQHWHECTANDGAKSSVANHKYNSNFVCTVCGYTHTHSYSTAWSFNATQHWRECTADDGAKTGTANHTGSLCTACGYVGGENLVTLRSVEPNGGSTTTTTTFLRFLFSDVFPGLSVDDITLSGVAGVTKGTLTSSTGLEYSLQISGFTTGGTLTVTVAKTGYNISNSSRTIPIYYVTPVTFSSLTANGSATATTTELTLTFSAAIAGLSADDITLSSEAGISVTKGTLSGAGPTYTLPISGVNIRGTWTLRVAVATKTGYNISGSPKTVNIYYGSPATFSSLTANGSATSATTTRLTLTFSGGYPVGLSADDITLSGVAGVTKGTLSSDGGSTYTLPISGFTAGGTLSVTVSKTGYSISDSSRTVTIYYYSGSGGLPVEMVSVPGGSFQMGGDGQSKADGTTSIPKHTVTLTGFYLGKYEVTQAQWQAVMESLPSQLTTGDNYGRGDNYPVYYVSWYDALVFCNKLSMRDRLTPAYRINNSTDPTAWGTVPTTNNTTWNAVAVVSGSTGYRLPTEAQWEYAARGGNGSPGNYTYAGSNTVDDVAWYRDNSGDTAHAVGKKAPNGLGLYDMSGNVSEWCWDWYGSYSSGAQTDPTGASSGSNRVKRGGCWYDTQSARSAFRSFGYPDDRYNYLGFRVLRPAQ